MPSILADALEAVFGAVFLDGGFDAARAVIERMLRRRACATPIPATLGKDPKTRLQEWLQARRLPVPEYAIVATTGEAHAQLFTSNAGFPRSAIVDRGTGTSRRAAEQDGRATQALARHQAERAAARVR